MGVNDSQLKSISRCFLGWLPLYYTPIAYTLHEFEKWALRDLNPGPADYESDALTTELSALFKTVPEWGFEPHNSIVFIDRLPTMVICNRTVEH